MSEKISKERLRSKHIKKITCVRLGCNWKAGK
jgi:hypothetical protein